MKDKTTSDNKDNSVEAGSLARKSFIGLVWSALEAWGGQFFTLLIFIVLARILGPEDFGIVAMAGVYIAFVQIFINQGLTVALVQRKDLEEIHLHTAFWMSFGTGLVLAALSWFVAPYVASLYQQPELTWIVRALSVGLVLASLSCVPVALMRRHFRFRSLAIRTLIATVVGGIAALIMALNGYGVWSLVVQQLVANITKIMMLWLQTDWRPKLAFSGKTLKELLPFSLSILGNNLVEFGNRQSDKLIVGLILGPVALGYYVLGYRIYRTVNMALTGFVNQVSISSFSSIQTDIPRLKRAYYSASRIASSITFPMYIMLILFAPYFVPTLIGEEWRSSIPVLQIFLLAGLLESIGIFNASIMISLRKPHWKLGIGIVNLIFNVVGFYVFAKFGIVYVALVYTIRTYLMFPVPLYLVRRLIGIDYLDYFKGISIQFGFAAVLLLIFWFVVSEMFNDNSRYLPMLLITTILFPLYVLLLAKTDSTVSKGIKMVVGKIKR